MSVSSGAKLSPVHILFVFTFFCSLFYGLSEGWYSSILLWNIGAVFAIWFLRTFYKSERNGLVKVFMFAYSMYSLYMFITNYIYVVDPSKDFFMIVDSIKFWHFSDYPLDNLSDLKNRFVYDLSYTYNYWIFNGINLFLSFFAQIFDENNILVLKLQNVWLGAFSMPFVYLSLRKFFNKSKSYNYTLFFAVFSYACIYSVVLFRDTHVYFLYTIATYLLIYYDSKKYVLLKFVVIFVLLLGFRIEHGLFFIMFFLAYFYLRTRKNKLLIIPLSVLIPIGIAVLAPTLSGNYMETAETYQGRIERVDRNEESAGATASKLPPGFKQILMAANGQIAPAVPFWRQWFPEKTNRTYRKLGSPPGYFTPWRFMEALAAVVWLYLWGFIILGYLKKVYKRIPIEVKLLFGIAIMLLLVASSAINARRYYCVYPAIFIVSMMAYNLLSKRSRRLAIRFTTCAIGVLYIGYFIFKDRI